jgi:hypothetical protein
LVPWAPSLLYPVERNRGPPRVSLLGLKIQARSL